MIVLSSGSCSWRAAAYSGFSNRCGDEMNAKIRICVPAWPQFVEQKADCLIFIRYAVMECGSTCEYPQDVVSWLVKAFVEQDTTASPLEHQKQHRTKTPVLASPGAQIELYCEPSIWCLKSSSGRRRE